LDRINRILRIFREQKFAELAARPSSDKAIACFCFPGAWEIGKKFLKLLLFDY